LKPIQDRIGVHWSEAYVGLGTLGLALVTMIVLSLAVPDRKAAVEVRA